MLRFAPRKLAVVLGLHLVIVAVAPEGASAQRPLHVAEGDLGMVVSVRADASRIGRDALRQGGNAVDASVATALALAVSWPEAGNIGGGGFMLVHPGFGGEPACIDYRETAPAAATETMFAADDGKHTHKIVGVPGTVRGLALAHQRFGKLPWRQLVEPAVTLAREGAEVDAILAQSINRVLRSTPVDEDRFAELHRVYGHPDERPWRAGDRLVLPDLARTLQQIASDGPNAFYRGQIASSLASEMRRGDGLITLDDLGNYQAKIRTPVHSRFRDFDIWGAPPPSSGGIAVAQALNVLEKLEIQREERFSPTTLHLLGETLRRVFLDRARNLGDPDFVEMQRNLLDLQYAAELAADIRRDRATPSESLADDIELALESDNTTHFSVVDAQGMAVSNTYTLEASWGARIVVPGAGFVLNNEMGDFNWRPGHTDRKGNIGTSPNLIAPGKRMLSSQSPTIVTRSGRVELVVGSPGGRTIISTVVNVLLNVLQYEMPLSAAVAAPRLHHQWLPDELNIENAREPSFAATAARLEQFGHRLKASTQGSVHAIAVRWTADAVASEGVSDNRRGGLAASWESKVVADWQFEEHRGAALAECRDEGPARRAWSRNLPRSTTDGNGAFRVQGKLDEAIWSFAPLFPAVPTEQDPTARYQLHLSVSSARWKSSSANKTLWVGFAESSSSAAARTALQLHAWESGETMIRGEASGAEATEGAATDASNNPPRPRGEPAIEPAISPTVKRAIEPTIEPTIEPAISPTIELAIELAPLAKSYRLRQRENGAWRELAAGATPENFAPRFLAIGAQGDFSQADEAIAIHALRVVRAE